MRVLQIVQSLMYGDAVGNDVIAIKNALKSLGYKTQIYAMSIAPNISFRMAKKIRKLPRLNDDDIIIYHLASGSWLIHDLAEFKGKKIVIYHNVTPPVFFKGYSSKVVQMAEKGLEGARFLADKVDYCLADSEFNKQDLIKMGYSVPIDVLPILIPFDEYKKKPDQTIIDKYQDGAHNIIFTGRVAPNKCHQDIIAAFACYKKYYDKDARLFLVGSYKETDRYYKKLQKYVRQLEVDDVFFTGHIRFEEILSYYCIADLFLCMSEHEGFCVPLLEAMFFEVPIIAYDCTAVPETLGDAGILIETKNPLETAALMNRVINDSKLKSVMKENQKRRLENYKYGVIKSQIKAYLDQFI